MRTRVGVDGSLAWLCAAGLGLACASGGIVYTTGPGAVSGDGLHRVRWSDLGAEFVKPGADLRPYRQVLLDPVTISSLPADVHADPALRRYPPPPDYLDAMRRYYQESFAGEFGRGAFTLASQPGPDVLRISGHVVHLSVTAPPNPEQEPDVTWYEASLGELTLVLDVRDAASGAPLLRTADRQPIALDPVSGFTQDTSVGQASALRQVFGHEARLLRERLEELQRLPEVPPASP
jgi:hypothetical protein